MTKIIDAIVWLQKPTEVKEWNTYKGFFHDWNSIVPRRDLVETIID